MKSNPLPLSITLYPIQKGFEENGKKFYQSWGKEKGEGNVFEHTYGFYNILFLEIHFDPTL